MESAMTLKSIPLSALCPPKGNPRRTVDRAGISSLAESIKGDGLLRTSSWNLRITENSGW
jgi:ParB-like chromosome segregation protein Spo0J